MGVVLGFELPRELRLLTRYFELPSQLGPDFSTALFIFKHSYRLVALKNCALPSYYYTLRNNPDERSSHLVRSISLKPRIV